MSGHLNFTKENIFSLMKFNLLLTQISGWKNYLVKYKDFIIKYSKKPNGDLGNWFKIQLKSFSEKTNMFLILEIYNLFNDFIKTYEKLLFKT